MTLQAITENRFAIRVGSRLYDLPEEEARCLQSARIVASWLLPSVAKLGQNVATLYRGTKVVATANKLDRSWVWN